MNGGVALTMLLCSIDTAHTNDVIVIEVNRDGTTGKMVLEGTKPVSIGGHVRSRARVKSKRCVKCNTIVDQAASCCWKCGSKRLQ